MKKILTFFTVALLAAGSFALSEKYWPEQPRLPHTGVAIWPDGVAGPSGNSGGWHKASWSPNEVNLISNDCVDLFTRKVS